ncbi:hypothetical protein [Curtobacterium sp. MCBA15_001]|uniref:hypothetical protein n=1 Tax=Curtobacterium sp. MCBA15_001 TaxID=1898731 RepID=UPI0008DE0349|nr:hypothetical protein [Curtobacterium sp. MCBA15_001]OIH95273.1 hypothetical protein BIU90_00720 [Curtobacterium sp. MCBA15_001]
MDKFIAPAALAAALVATVAVPTAAQAATPVPTPEIGAVFSNGEHTSVYDGIAELEFSPVMGIGSATGDDRFAGVRVDVVDDQGNQVCTTETNPYVSDGGWDCYATPLTLGAGVHTIHAVAYDSEGRPAAESAPVRLTVGGGSDDAGDDSTAQPAPGPVDVGFTHPGAGAGSEDTTAQPAPGPVDWGFTHPGAGESGGSDAPTAEWAVIRFQGGAQHVLARLHTAPNAVVVVTESNGTQHGFMADDDGIAKVDVEWLGGYAPTFTAVAHVGGTTSGSVTVTPTRG